MRMRLWREHSCYFAEPIRKQDRRYLMQQVGTSRVSGSWGYMHGATSMTAEQGDKLDCGAAIYVEIHDGALRKWIEQQVENGR